MEQERARHRRRPRRLRTAIEKRAKWQVAMLEATWQRPRMALRTVRTLRHHRSPPSRPPHPPPVERERNQDP